MHHAGVTLAAVHLVVDSTSCFLPIPVSRCSLAVSQEDPELTARGILPLSLSTPIFPHLNRLVDWIPDQYHVASFGFSRDFNRAMFDGNLTTLLALQPWSSALTAGKTPYPQFVLFGDSITQQAFDQTHGFAAAAQLANGR